MATTIHLMSRERRRESCIYIRKYSLSSIVKILTLITNSDDSSCLHQQQDYRARLDRNRQAHQRWVAQLPSLVDAFLAWKATSEVTQAHRDDNTATTNSDAPAAPEIHYFDVSAVDVKGASHCSNIYLISLLILDSLQNMSAYRTTVWRRAQRCTDSRGVPWLFPYSSFCCI